jgi:hypothetical protein
LGKIINCTANTFTISLTAAATLGSGFNCIIWNTGAGTITIDPASTETIDGFTTLILRAYQGVEIVCNGTNWQSGSPKTYKLYQERLNKFDQALPIASGEASMAFGLSSTSSGLYSFSCVASALASGEGSFAAGIFTQATASYSVAMGYDARATGNSSVAIGSNTSFTGARATGGSSIALGAANAGGTDSVAISINNNTTSYGTVNNDCVAIGSRARAAAAQARSIGGYAVASGQGSLCLSTDLGVGYGSQATDSQSVAIGYGASSTIRGKYAYAGNILGTSIGNAQTGTFVLIAQTTTNTATVLTTDNSAAGTNDQIILPNNSAYAFMGIIVARQQASGGTATAAWKIEGVIRREANAASTTLIASTVTAIDNTPGWTLALSADTTNGGLAVTATGAAATNIRWVATVQTSEVTY